MREQTSFDALLRAPPKVAEAAPAAPPPLSVTELNRSAARLLEERFSQVSVLGEISGFLNHRSGHWYFGLKDENGQVACCCFKGNQRGIAFQPKDGQQVVARGRLTIYEQRGAYQFVVDQMQLAGAGALQQRFEELKAKLAAEGLFAAARKRQLPTVARSIALVTSSDGAVVRDFVRVALRRNPGVRIVVIPTRVQGPGAADEIARAIDLASERAAALGLDVIVVARGGGSVEDLWAFNEEVVVRALARAALPTVSAIGHEIDVTLCDFAADVRAPTPSAAAELCVHDAAAVAQKFVHHARALEKNTRLHLHRLRARLSAAQHTFRDPSARLQRKRQQLDELEARIEDALNGQVRGLLDRLRRAELSLEQNHPRHRLQIDRQKLATLQVHLVKALRAALVRSQHRLAQAAGKLDALSPLSVLSRGYAVVLKGEHAVRKASDVAPGDDVKILLHEGAIHATVNGEKK